MSHLIHNFARLRSLSLFVSVAVFLWCSSTRAAISDPRDLDGNVLWLDASDVDGDFEVGGAFLDGTTWVDKSPLQNANASQATSSALPSIVESAFNGLSVIDLDGNDFMDIDSAAFGMLRNVESATLIGVLTTELTSSNRGMRAFMVSSGTNSAGSRAGINLFDSFGTSIGGSGDFGLAGRRLDSDDFQRIEGGEIVAGELSTMAGVFNYQDSEIVLFVDGEEETRIGEFQTAGSTSDTDSLNIRIGADAVLGNPRGFFTGQIAELIVYDRALTESELADVDAYIDSKWLGISSCAPINELLGDLDGDGSVAFADFLVMSSNFGSADSEYADGDVDCDGSVQFADFLTLSSNFGRSLATPTASAASIPEPSSAVLVWIILVLLVPITRGRRLSHAI